LGKYPRTPGKQLSIDYHRLCLEVNVGLSGDQAIDIPRVPQTKKKIAEEFIRVTLDHY